MGEESIEKFEVYERPEIYDFAFSRGLESEMRFFHELRRMYSLPEKCKVIDMGCGSGDWLIELAQAGHQCFGFDSCESMVSFAREKCSDYSVNVFNGDLYKFEIKAAFDAAFCLCGTIHHLYRADELEAHFRSLSSCLAPNGMYLIDLHVSEPGRGSELEQHWIVEGDADELEVFFRYVPGGFDCANQRQWVELEVRGEINGEDVFLQNQHWFGAFTAERILNAADHAGLMHLGWYSDSPDVAEPLFDPAEHPSVYGLFCLEA
jgi:SAM-dependent methyltransferase